MVFFLEITNIWQKSQDFWFAVFYFEILKIHGLVWIFLWIFGCFESVSSKYIEQQTKKRAPSKIWKKVKKVNKHPPPTQKKSMG
jgi:hypothetical protein